MTSLEALGAAIESALQTSDPATAAVEVSASCAAALPCEGAAMTVMASDTQRQTVFASDEVIAEVEQRQFTLGEGPSLRAFTTSRPVLAPDIADPSAHSRWPMFVDQLADTPVRGLFCFPMQFGAIKIGVCAFYRTQPARLDASEVAFVLAGLELTTLALLEVREGASEESLLAEWLEIDGLARRQVHQATGMVIAQLAVSPESAFARLRGHAFTQGVGIEQVADDIVNRRDRLEPDTV